MGTASYLKLADVPGVPYKTTLLGERWDVGDAESGCSVRYGRFQRVGFVVSAVALLAVSTWWRSLLVLMTCFSLVSRRSIGTFAGVTVKVVILGLLWLGCDSAELCQTLTS